MIELPVPPPVNQKYGVFKGRMLLQSDYRNYLKKARVLVQLSKLRPIEGDCEVEIIWFRTKTRGDIDNRVKPILDCLEGVAFKNDKQVAKLIVERRKGRDRMEVEVRPYEA